MDYGYGLYGHVKLKLFFIVMLKNKKYFKCCIDHFTTFKN